MQILQWLFKIAEEEPQRIVSNSISISQKSRNHEEEVKRKDLVILMSDHKGRKKHVKRVGNSKVGCENLILLRFFHQTLNLKGLGSFVGCLVPLKKTKKKRGDSAARGENKVLPIADSQLQSSSDSDSKAKKTKKAAVSRMKELLEWAATAKVLKGAGLKAEEAVAANDDVVGDESPKISFRLEMEDYSHDFHAAGMGNWITTDTEFVVLEL